MVLEEGDFESSELPWVEFPAPSPAPPPASSPQIQPSQRSSHPSIQSLLKQRSIKSPLPLSPPQFSPQSSPQSVPPSSPLPYTEPPPLHIHATEDPSLKYNETLTMVSDFEPALQYYSHQLDIGARLLELGLLPHLVNPLLSDPLTSSSSSSISHHPIFAWFVYAWQVVNVLQSPQNDIIINDNNSNNNVHSNNNHVNDALALFVPLSLASSSPSVSSRIRRPHIPSQSFSDSNHIPPQSNHSCCWRGPFQPGELMNFLGGSTRYEYDCQDVHRNRQHSINRREACVQYEREKKQTIHQENIQGWWPIVDEEYWESIDVLLAVYTAYTQHEQLITIELGARYAPWSSLAYRAATLIAAATPQSSRPPPVVIAVEADHISFQWLLDHLAANDVPLRGVLGLNVSVLQEQSRTKLSEEHTSDARRAARLISLPVPVDDSHPRQGVINVTAVPSAALPSQLWDKTDISEGGLFAVRGIVAGDSETRPGVRHSPSLTLIQLLQPLEHVHLIDFDVQGFELESVMTTETLLALNRKVRMIHFGTRSPQIEDALLAGFREQGWKVLWYLPCGHTTDRKPIRTPYGPVSTVDGVLTVINTRFPWPFLGTAVPRSPPLRPSGSVLLKHSPRSR